MTKPPEADQFAFMAAAGEALTRLAHDLTASAAFGRAYRHDRDGVAEVLARLPHRELRRTMGAADTLAQVAEKIMRERGET